MERKKNFPVFKVKVGNIDVAVWQQLNNNKKPYYSISYEKSYKSELEEWKKTKNLLISDIPNLIKGLEKAFEYGRVKIAKV